MTRLEQQLEVTLNKLGTLSERTNRLRNLPDHVWFAPLAAGKWSLAEMLSHIMFWDKFLIEQAIPDLLKKDAIEFAEFDSFNKNAARFAMSGIDRNALLDLISDKRESLLQLVRELPASELTKPIQVDGQLTNPHTGEAFTLMHLLEDFAGHDEHHLAQISLEN